MKYALKKENFLKNMYTLLDAIVRRDFTKIISIQKHYRIKAQGKFVI